MTSKQIPFFATSNDLSSLLTSVLSECSLDFVQSGLFAVSMTKRLGPDDLEPFSNYIVVCRGYPVSVRTVPQRHGADRYAVDQLQNPESVSLSLGGTLQGHHLVASQVGTTGGGVDIYKQFERAICRQFERVKSYYVGSEAGKLMDTGVRLSPTKRSPRDYDLTRG
jgi:hypothetical protein